MPDSPLLRRTAFEVLQQFGGSQPGLSDHCLLWCRFERGRPERYAMTIEEQKVNEAFLDADILRQIENFQYDQHPLATKICA